MSFHINPESGEPGKCSAKAGNCPFGSDDSHYSSPEAARTAFESSNRDLTFTMSLKDMNAAAKDTSDHAEIASIIANGSDRTLSNLAKNPNLTDQEVRAALAATSTPSVRAVLLIANKGPHELMTPEDLEEILTRLPAREKYTESHFMGVHFGSAIENLANNPSISDAHWDKVKSSSRLRDNVKLRFNVVLGAANKMSPKKTREWLELNNWPVYPISAERALINGKLGEQDLVDAPDRYMGNFSATGPSPILETKQVDMLGRVAMKRRDERLQMWVARDSRTSPSMLEAMGSVGLQQEEIYKNPNTPSTTKDKIAKSQSNKPYVRMDELKKRLGDAEFNELTSQGQGKTLGRAYHESTLVFDVERVRKYGLTNDDISYLAGASRFNAGTSYNPLTGEFSGRTDSSD